MEDRKWGAAEFEDVERRMARMANPGIRPGLSRIARLLETLGHPERSFRAMHVVGTNGKGSTAALAESVLRSGGVKTALYTSPHLLHFGERFRVSGEILPPEAWHRAIDEVESALRKTGDAPTLFEVSTAAAFLLACSQDVDFAVVEAGLGGRLDATNILAGVSVTVLTAMGLDHQEYLGATLAEVAAEKFAVLRPGGKSCFAGGCRELERAYAERCRFMGNDGVVLSSAGRWSISKMDAAGTIFDASLFGKTYRDLEIGLVGRHQAANAMNALAALSLLAEEDIAVSEDQIRQGFKNARFPGRIDFRRFGNGTVILDGAHNPHGIAALTAAIRELFPGGGLAILFASMSDKDYERSLEILKTLDGELLVTQVPDMERSAKPGDLQAAALRAGWPGPVKALDSPDEALREALKAGNTVLCCGSLYLAAAVLKLVGGGMAPDAVG